MKVSREKGDPGNRILGILASLGRFWASFGAQLGAKGVPKSRVVAPGCAKISKNDIQNEASEKL